MQKRLTPQEPRHTALFPWELNAIIGDHIEITDTTGYGGMATVYRAWHKPLRREVGIKLLPKPDMMENPLLESYFREEARAMARLDHPNIVKVHDIGETFRGDLYLIMQYVHGFDLAQVIAGGGLNQTHAKSWIPQVGVALDYAHQQGILHRDIKPGNILIDRNGKAMVTDFGLVKRLTPGSGSAPEMLGTRPYAAPELPDVPSPQSDIYSLGAVLYELLTGKAPEVPCKPPSLLVPVLDPRYDVIVARAMHRRPVKRYPSAYAMTEDVLQIGVTPAPSATSEAKKVLLPIETQRPRPKTHPWGWIWLRRSNQRRHS